MVGWSDGRMVGGQRTEAGANSEDPAIGISAPNMDSNCHKEAQKNRANPWGQSGVRPVRPKLQHTEQTDGRMVGIPADGGRTTEDGRRSTDDGGKNARLVKNARTRDDGGRNRNS